VHHYQNDLTKIDEIVEVELDYETLPRYLIPLSEEYFKTLFSLLDFGGEVAASAWSLIIRLPTSPDLF